MQSRNSYTKVNIEGRKFGRLTAIYKVENAKSLWHFRCDCGAEIDLIYSRILGGQKSCGCLSRECRANFGKSHKTHGQSRTKLYRKYRSMLDRCYRKDNRGYPRYGGRGIKVCDEWKSNFETFRDWAYATGYNPSLDGNTEQSIDRVDNDGDYSPQNCRWATAKEQTQNRRCTTFYPYHTQLYNASEFAGLFGIEKTFVYNRLKKGQTLEYILNDWNKIHNVPSHLEEVEEYAKRYGTTSANVRRWINSNKIKGEKVGRKWYVVKENNPKGGRNETY